MAEAVGRQRKSRRACFWVAVILAVVSTIWFGWLQPPNPDALHPASFPSLAWLWYPREQNAVLRLPAVPDVALNKIHMLADGRMGWAVGDHGVILHTADGGITWELQANVTWPAETTGDTKGTAGNEKIDASAAEKQSAQENNAKQAPLKATEIPLVKPVRLSTGLHPSLEDVAFVNALQGWAVGDEGTILHTIDGGQSWSAQSSNTSEILRAVTFLADGQHGWVVGEGGTILNSTDGGQIWSPQTSNTIVSLHSVSFLADGKEGWVAENAGTILRTSDGGQSWTGQPNNGTDLYFSVTFLADGRRGWAVGEFGTILHSGDGGQSWSAQTSHSGAKLFSVTFLADAKTGWAVGENGTILHTTDAGQNWLPQTSNTTAELSTVTFLADGQRGWAAGDGGTILHTTDGGERWFGQTNTTQSLLSVAFLADGEHGWSVGRGGTILHTSDGGESWAAQISNTTEWLQSVTFLPDGRLGWALGINGTILHTEDGGHNWLAQSQINIAELYSVKFLADGQRGWVVGDNGAILHTRDGGQSWSIQSSHATQRLYSVTLLEDGQYGHVVGSSGTILHTTDGGQSWSAQTSNTTEWLRSVTFLADGQRGWAVGDQGTILHTKDGGQVWSAQTSNTKQWLYSVTVLPDRQRGWAVGREGTILHSTDGGQSWAPQSSGTTAWLYSVTFLADGLRGWAVGEGGTILRTTDGGQTWRGLEYKRFPAPAFYLAVVGVVGLLWVAARPVPPIVVQQGESIADRYLSDRPLEPHEAAGSDLARLAKGLSNYLRNKNTGAPLVLAVTGAWGSGKSSLMNLLRGDLVSRGFRPVWFNAWHHQQEEHLLAALLESIRSQGVPELWSGAGLEFRRNLLWERYRKRWWLVASAVAGLAIAAAWLPRVGFTELDFTKPDSLLKLIPLGAAAAPLLALWKLFQAFGLNPAQIVLSEGAKSSDISAQTSFRYRFAQEFGEVSRALQPRSMVIFIDDLDRCQPDHMMTVLESVNFLATSGPCFIVIGMEETAVLDCLATRLTWRAEAEADGASKDAWEAERRRYAQLWLEKLIQVKIPVPRMSLQESQAILIGSNVEVVEPPDHNVPNPLLLNSGWGASWSRLRTWLAWSRLRPQLMEFARTASGKVLSWAALLVIVGVASLSYFVGLRLPAPAKSDPPQHQIPEWVSKVKFVGQVDKGTVQLSLQDRGAAISPVDPHGASIDNSPTQKSTVSNPPAPAVPANGPAQTPAAVSLEVTPGQTARWNYWLPLSVLGLLALMSVFVLGQQVPVIVEDSDDFREHMNRWWPVISETHTTPRALKRFVNRVRFYAMLVRDPDNPEAKPRIREDIIVGFGVLESCRRETFKDFLDGHERRHAELPGSSPRFDIADAKLEQQARNVVAELQRNDDVPDFRRLTQSIIV